MSVSDDVLNSLVKFLSPEARADVKTLACNSVAQLTGTPEGLQLLSSRPDVLKAVVRLVHNTDTSAVSEALTTLINLSAEETGCKALLDLMELCVVDEMIKCIKNKDHPHADLACGVLANLSKPRALCQKVLDQLNLGSNRLEELTRIFCQMDYNKKGANLHRLASMITNISQLKNGRKLIMDKNGFVLNRLLPFVTCKESVDRRYAAVATLHNCCFDKASHEWLLGEEVEVTGRLLLPLAGPDTFTLEENDKLPLDLQYLPNDKTREPEPNIRRLLLEALMQLCVTRHGRESLREQNVYLVLREHHKWETDHHCLMLNEDVVNLLIRTEDEIGADDLSSVEVSDDMAKKFTAQDEHYLAGGNT
ncbi:protein HGH1 homolog [Portunus trituberculatus]|uniref:protein HGH1 homolog n=1 Tax=Portunus trituberculatus TaxID=210409 RepID=UPI001E1D0430|nr:protein HGH1 homolog [Portunus trituberculatus]XP_045130042.1 protein HGH1 homolog [Portunus trituberculatus]XP_045130043.1 protein HGH1 homolog [Portunus trituberculatus]XP_045130044.1 protein HGH1 homolog [Portunus trituberculatus]